MFSSLPPDVIEHIAYYASTHTLLEPPSDLVTLLTLCRSVNASLNRSSNPHLYARIFAAKFDLAAPRRRLARLYGQDARSVLSVKALADELVRRFTILKRIRGESDARSLSNVVERASTPDNLIADAEADAMLDEILWTAFLMVLEDAGRNTAQLRSARIEGWLAVFWFDGYGASGAMHKLAADQWPVIAAHVPDSKLKTRHALGMWLLWFFLNPAAYVANPDLYRRAERILKLVALNVSLYPLSHLPWTSFNPEPTHIHFGLPGVASTEPFDPRTGSGGRPQQPALQEVPVRFKYFGHQLPQLKPLPPAVPASLALLALHTRSRRNADTLEGGLELVELLGPSLGEPFIALPEAGEAEEGGIMQNTHGNNVEGGLDVSALNGNSNFEKLRVSRDGYRWEYEWLRCIHAVDRDGLPLSVNHIRNAGAATEGKIGDRRKYKTYDPGYLEGSWEGPFNYIEFHTFAALLSGANPSNFQDCLSAQHNQTWRLREYHLLAPTRSTPAQTNGSQRDPIPLPVGDAILAHVPEYSALEDDLSLLRITLSSSFTPPPTSSSSNSGHLPTVFTYTRYRKQDSGDENGETYASRVLDILLSGEGHSGWGEFRLLGRIRTADGFISVVKNYTNGDRGRWLYRGYLVGGGTASPESGLQSEDGEEVGESKGYIVGRWRDTLTPAETHGYEGIFALARRQ